MNGGLTCAQAAHANIVNAGVKIRWCAPRIHGELLKLGIDIGETSMDKYIVRTRKPPSQTWRTFLANHVKTMVSIDFFTVSRTGSGSVMLDHES